MHVAIRTNLHITQNVTALHVGKGRVFFADRLDSERIISSQRVCFDLFSANLRHDLLFLVEFPSEEIMEDFGRALVASALALPLDLEIIERCGMAAGLVRVSVIVASLIP